MGTWTERRHASAVRAIFQALGRRDFDVLRRWFAADVEVNDRPWSLKLLVEDMAGLVEAYPDFFWDVDRVIAEGPYVSVRYHASGTNLKPHRGHEPRSSKIVTQQMIVLLFEHRRITRMWLASGRPVIVEELEDGLAERREGQGSPYDRP